LHFHNAYASQPLNWQNTSAYENGLNSSHNGFVKLTPFFLDKRCLGSSNKL
jgi:hypothetical protein